MCARVYIRHVVLFLLSLSLFPFGCYTPSCAAMLCMQSTTTARRQMNVVAFHYFFIHLISSFFLLLLLFFFFFHCLLRRNSEEMRIDWWRPQSRTRWECRGSLHALRHNNLIHSNRLVVVDVTTARSERKHPQASKQNTRNKPTEDNLWTL